MLREDSGTETPKPCEDKSAAERLSRSRRLCRAHCNASWDDPGRAYKESQHLCCDVRSSQSLQYDEPRADLPSAKMAWCRQSLHGSDL